MYWRNYDNTIINFVVEERLERFSSQRGNEVDRHLKSKWKFFIHLMSTLKVEK